jgi:hypothetical protein
MALKKELHEVMGRMVQQKLEKPTSCEKYF